MRVAVLGATGVVGRHVLPRLVERGHAPVAIARDEGEAVGLRRSGVEAGVADVFDADALAAVVAGCGAAMHLATAIPPPGPRQDWSLNDRIRREGTSNLVDACLRAGVRRYVQQSVAFLAGGSADLIDETAPLLSGTTVTASAIDMERLVARSALDWMIVRDGLLYGPGTGREDGWRDQARRGELMLPGDGSSYVSLVHVADLAEAFALAVEREGRREIVAAVDDVPVTYRELFGFLASQLDVAAPQAGGPGAMPSFRISNAKAKTVLGWTPCFRSYRSGLA